VLSSRAQPTVSFTFDDGITQDMPGYTFDEWNSMLLSHLDSAHVKAILFATGSNKLDNKGKSLLESWNARGHRIANHTFSHPNYNSKKVTFEIFAKDFLKNDSIIRQFENYIPLFRFPYLKEGDTEEKVEMFRALLKKNNYKNGYVTIDASDWYIDSRLRSRLKENPSADISGFRQFYLDHMYNKALYYEDLAYKLTGRHIHHTLLLHHNLTSALFLGDLIALFKEKGWNITDADKAFADEIFQQTPGYAGESIIWALAKASGKYENMIRYPAEDSQYEKEKMDNLGL
jgi:peptidoglycan/xylan/chitin deacetylase (PgdA/CDA1 family)